MAEGSAKPGYQPIDMHASGPGAVAVAFANQVAYCTNASAPITARVVAAVGDLLDSGADGEFLTRIRNWQGAPLADALPLRVAGAIHSLHLSGTEPGLDAIYRGEDAGDAAVIGAAIQRHEARLLPWLKGPPQTNEAGRSSNFMAAMLWLASRGLPPRFDCLEIGSSAGINLMMDRYGYDLGGVRISPGRAVMTFTPEWRGEAPPAGVIEFARLKGSDVAPVDLTDPTQALRLKAYVWPEHTVRFERIEAAIAAAKDRAPDLVEMNAADFIETELAQPQAEGETRVLMHSIVWQYVPADQQARVTAAMEAAGSRATLKRPLAWIALEANRDTHRHELVVRYWPGGEGGVKLAEAHPHGAWIAWRGG